MESWLSAELIIPGYSVLRKDHNRHGGGVIIFEKSSLSYTIIPSFTSVTIELLSFVIDFYNYSKFFISVFFYQPPNSGSSQFDQLLIQLNL